MSSAPHVGGGDLNNADDKIRELQLQCCDWCNTSFRGRIRDEEDIQDQVFICESNHGPFCRDCWGELSKRCPDCPDDKNLKHVEPKWAECGNCHRRVKIDSSTCNFCASPFVGLENGILQINMCDSQFEDGYRVLQPDDYWNLHIFGWCCLNAFVILLEFNPHWSEKRIGIYIVSFIFGWFWWPWIGIPHHFFLRKFCQIKGFELVKPRSFGRGDRLPKQYEWDQINAIERRNNLGTTPTE